MADIRSTGRVSTANPSYSSGTDRELSLDPSGHVRVTGTVTSTPSGTQDVNIVSSTEIEIKNDVGNPIPVNGTVTANAGTGPFPVSGSVSVSNFPATQNVAITSAVEVEVKNDSGNPIPVSGTVASTFPSSSTATLTNVSASASSVMLLASNANRKMGTFYNDSTATLSLKFGTTASATSFTVNLVSNAYFELPIPVYTGQIDGIWTVATGAARVTECTV